ncbi:Thiamine import ATP-binding protein ThiQ [Vibrio aerogenes CECT 7868]|uniref:Thiamine import ATP-binding protein ThiQ n=1 Tax=Vibrio aerogenes CECT 7868 TaxID=1216006 RepID=A0A1M5XJA5_9VIBR|nr:thiamine ABC transporter ATP-binding protein [Vibrio aerogenes]SHH99829.1 Thiamine import ATP-binding protein ThiQ [Vibrio aerogenes CECT 7868]
MLKLDQVRYQYQHNWFDFSLEVSRGTIVAIMGASGAGKSTLLSLTAGFITPDSGEISVDGRSVLSDPPYLRPFSVLFQEHNLFSHLTVRENIGLGLNPGLRLSREDQQQINQAAALVGIESMLERLPEQLSGGQKQRIALARCFVQARDYWLLDEPFSALDPVLREEMLTLVKRLARERQTTVLMVTHHLRDILSIAEQFVYVHENKVYATGRTADLSVSHPDPVLRDFVKAG